MKKTKTRGTVEEAARDPIDEVKQAAWDLTGSVVAVLAKHGQEATSGALFTLAIDLSKNRKRIEELMASRSELKGVLTIGDHLRAIRLRRQWTLQEMADQMGVHFGTYQGWEYGKHSPDSVALNEALFRIGEFIPLGARRLREF